MIIAKPSIDAYLNRPLASSAKAKRFTPAALDAKLSKLDPPPSFHTPPRHNQKVGFLLGVKYPRYLFQYDLGLGKSKQVIDLFSYALARSDNAYCHACQWHGRAKWLDEEPTECPCCGRCSLSERKTPRSLILVPQGSNIRQWQDQFATHAPGLRCEGVEVSGADNRMVIIDGNADAVVMTYMGFLALVCSAKTGEDWDGKPAKGWRIDDRKLQHFCDRFDFLILDEINAVANHQSLTHRACRKLSWSCTWCYGLTGTPFDKSPMDLWGQFYVVDKGASLGQTLGLYRGAFFNAKQNYWGGWDYTFKKPLWRPLSRMLRHRSLRYEQGECFDLPEKVDTVHPLAMPKEAWAYYSKLADDLRQQQKDGDKQGTQNSFHRLRQLASGYLTVKGEAIDDVQIVFKTNPKMDDLLGWLAEIPPGHKAIVWTVYIKSGELVCKALKDNKIKHRRLYSGTAKKGDTVDEFLSDPSVKVLVSSEAGAKGGNWQAANYMYFYESPVRPMIRKQEVGRCWRSGQSNTVFVVDPIIKGSIDERVLRSITNGEDVYEAIVNGKEPL